MTHIRRIRAHFDLLTQGAAALLTILLLATWPPGAAHAESVQFDTPLAEASALLDSGDPEGAIRILNRYLSRQPSDAEAFIVRSTAHFVLGDPEAGRRDLDRALELEPGLRQGWLNRAGVDLAEGNFARALEALSRAETLDPNAPDNHLNIGAALLMSGNREKAQDRFDRYLRQSRNAPEAIYLVATNYALAGLGTPAIGYLRHAVARDEKMRRRARTDPNFADLEMDPGFQEILNTDTYSVPAGYHFSRQVYDLPYNGADSALLTAVIDALQFGGLPLDPVVEVTPEWALVWSRARIKISQDADGGSVLQLSAPAGEFAPEEWNDWETNLLRSIAVRLSTRGY